jgi:hypothetical protein
MYICQKCTEKHALKTRPTTSSSGVCDICFQLPDPLLAWTDELMRVFPGDGLPSVEEQLKARLTESGNRKSAMQIVAPTIDAAPAWFH